MKRYRFAAFISLLALTLSGTARAGSSDGLADLLIEKGVITKEEYKTQKKMEWMNVEGWLQARYTRQENDNPKDNTSEFSLPRIRFGASGNAFENVEYKLEVDFLPDSKQKETLTADTTTGKVGSTKGDIESSSKISIKDIRVGFTKYPYANLTVGHFKPPFSRQEITSDAGQQFAERAEVLGKEAPGRDVGFMLGDYSGKKMFEYALGAFNGTKTSNKNDNDQFLYAARLAVNPFGEMKYSESNLESESLKMSVGASYLVNTVTKSGLDNTLDFSSGNDDVETDITKYGVDLAAKFLGNASIFAEYIKAKSDGGSEVKSKGYFVQGGYFVLPPKLELVARYEQYDPNDSVDNTSDIKWTTVGVNYFFHKHDLKLLANYTFKDEKKDPTSGKKKDDDTLMVQLQVKF